jgi:hypothetical protein
MHDQFGVLVQGEMRENYANGTSRVTQREISAYFKPDPLRPHEREYALSQFHFLGLYQEMDEATTVPPDYRIGIFDSLVAQEQNGWTDEERQMVEERLISDAEKYENVVVAPRASVPPPWPNYDLYQGTVPQLMKKLVAEGHDVNKTLIYERETQNRDRVVEAIEELLLDPAAVQAAVAEEVVVG